MVKLKLNDTQKRGPFVDGYRLNPAEKYLINIEEELEFQSKILQSFQISNPPPALKNYHTWLMENGFNTDLPNPTNEFVSQFYGVKPLWKTGFSQGMVVMAEHDSDYFIIMECSGKNKGYEHIEVILTLGGCM